MRKLFLIAVITLSVSSYAQRYRAEDNIRQEKIEFMGLSLHSTFKTVCRMLENMEFTLLEERGGERIYIGLISDRLAAICVNEMRVGELKSIHALFMKLEPGEEKELFMQLLFQFKKKYPHVSYEAIPSEDDNSRTVSFMNTESLDGILLSRRIVDGKGLVEIHYTNLNNVDKHVGLGIDDL